MDLRQAILNNLDQYTAEQLAEAIKDRTVTLDELKSARGGLDSTRRRRIEELLRGTEEEDFNAINANPTLSACQEYLDNYPQGIYRDKVREIMDGLSAQQAAYAVADASDADWARVPKDSPEALSRYCDEHPGSQYVDHAKSLINKIISDRMAVLTTDNMASDIQNVEGDTRQQRDNNTVSLIKGYLNKGPEKKAQLLSLLRDDPNIVSAGIIKTLVDDNVLTLYDLMSSAGIKEQFIKMMMNKRTLVEFDNSGLKPLVNIPRQSVEVYFWGIPSSGKTCALGAILSVASNGRIAKHFDVDTSSQGYDYLNNLKSHFREGEAFSLLGGTNIDHFFEMGFKLVDNNKIVHPLTCIDMSGELMACMYRSNARTLDDYRRNIINTMESILTDRVRNNPKMHFFVVEYGAENKAFNGLPQRAYLDAACSYIKDRGLFRNGTDYVCILISKIDKMKDITNEKVIEYIKTNYRDFYNGLNLICEENSINGGKVGIAVFSLGEVCFQNYCIFNPRYAEKIVNLLIDRSARYSTSKVSRFFNLFKK